MTDSVHTSIIDDARSACLCDVGLPGWHAVTCVGENGRQDLVLVKAEWIGDARYGYDPTCSSVAHEQLGPLPARWRSRVALAPILCGRPTKAGHRCRIPVTRPGAPCYWHIHTNERHSTP